MRHSRWIWTCGSSSAWPLPRTRIEFGELITDDKLRFDQRAVERVDQYLSSADTIRGKRARVTLMPGQVVTSNDVEAVPVENPVLIRPHDVVRLVASLGPLRVTAVGEALQDGRAGQFIRVRNVDSNHTVLGRVVDRTSVEVSY